MIPSSNWFPTSLQNRAAWCQNFGSQFANLAASLGFTPAEVSTTNADCILVGELAAIAIQLDAYTKAVRQYRTIITESPIGEKTPSFPAVPGYPSPAGPATGVFERIDDLVKRIRVSPTYTNEIGALLGILPTNSGNVIPPEDMQPTLKMQAMPGSVVQVKFVRGTTDGVAVEMKLDNADTWSDAGRYAASPAEIVIPQNAQQLPRAVLLRARYVDGNSPVGQFSDVVTTATLPNL